MNRKDMEFVILNTIELKDDLTKEVKLKVEPIKVLVDPKYIRAIAGVTIHYIEASALKSFDRKTFTSTENIKFNPEKI